MSDRAAGGDASDPPRIGVVTHNVDAGGAQRIAIEETRALAERGYDATLLSLVKPRDPWDALLEGIDHEYLVDVGDGVLGEGASRLAAGSVGLPRGYDAFVAHNLPGAQLCRRAARRHGTPYVAYVHDASAYPIAGSPFTLCFGQYSPEIDADDLGVAGRLGLALERRWLADASSVLANARRTAEELRARHGLGADVLYPTLIGATDAERADESVADAFLVVQRLEPHPTYDTVERLLERVPDLRVVIAGRSATKRFEDAVRGRFERFDDRVSFRVDPSDETLAGLYAGCRAFLHPGVENFNMSALEAASAGRPVVVAAESGITDLFEDYPLFAPAGDVDGFARAVRRVLDDPAEARRLGDEAAEVAASHGRAYHVETLLGALTPCLVGGR